MCLLHEAHRATPRGRRIAHYRLETPRVRFQLSVKATHARTHARACKHPHESAISFSSLCDPRNHDIREPVVSNSAFKTSFDIKNHQWSHHFLSRWWRLDVVRARHCFRLNRRIIVLSCVLLPGSTAIFLRFTAYTLIASITMEPAKRHGEKLHASPSHMIRHDDTYEAIPCVCTRNYIIKRI